jgi:hypothetical protein
MSVAHLRRAAAAALLVLAVARSSAADEELHPLVPAPPPGAAPAPARLVWRWPRFRTAEYYATGIAGLVAAGSLVIPQSPGRWRGGILVDEDVRDGIGLGSYRAQRGARDASDVLIAALIAYPVLVDGVIVTYGAYESADVAEQMLLIDAEVLAITAAMQTLIAGLASRERPYGRNCGDGLPEESRDCRQRSRHRSFYSGHSSIAFAAAGLSCSHHVQLELYGGGAADAAACGGALVAAAATGALRVIGDVHYVSDVAIGAAWGSLTGFGLPWLLHYRTSRAPKRRPTGFRLQLVPVGIGAGVGGAF